MDREQLPEAGDRIGQYELIRVLGHGGMGIVYEARDGEQRVALKLLPPDPRLSAEELEHSAQRMAREFSVLVTLQHPNVVRVLAFGRLGRRAWFAMELIQGETLDAWMEARPEPVAVAALFRKLASGVGELHRLGLVHRDLKPSNVMVRADGEPVLLDFGIVQSRAAPTLTSTREMPGTARYASPELVVWSRGARRTAFQYTPAYDVHALGVMLYEALTGKYPFQLPVYDELGIRALQAIQRERPRHPSALAPQVPRALGNLCMRMLVKNPARRPRDGAVVERALSALALGGEPAGWKLPARVALLVCLALCGVRLAVAWAPPPWLARVPPVLRPAAKTVDVPGQPLQPVSLPESPTMVKPPLPAVPPAPAPKLAALEPKPARKGLESRAVLLACATALGACHGDVRRQGVLAYCPPPLSPTAKRLGVSAGFEFGVEFLERDRARLDKGMGPPREGGDENTPRYLVPLGQAVELEFNRPVFQMMEDGTEKDVEPPFPWHSHVFGLVKPGPKQTEVVFTRMVLPDGSEYPMCAVAYANPSSWSSTHRALFTPVGPPFPPPGYAFVDTWFMAVHVMEPF